MINLKTIVFTKSRKIAELIYRWTIESNPKFLNYIAPYRAGYMPSERREIEKKLLNRKRGLVYVFTGDGEGKTTAALGLGLRALGHGKTVVLIQFMKGRKYVG